MTSKEVAQWMLDQMGGSHWLHQPLHKGFRCRVERNLFTGTRTESAASDRPCWSSLEGLPNGSSFGSLASVHGKGSCSGAHWRLRFRRGSMLCATNPSLARQ